MTSARGFLRARHAAPHPKTPIESVASGSPPIAGASTLVSSLDWPAAHTSLGAAGSFRGAPHVVG